jgi:hypothetical protein
VIAAYNWSLGHTGHRDALGGLGNAIGVGKICRLEDQLEESAEKEIVVGRGGRDQTGIVIFACKMTAFVSHCHGLGRNTNRHMGCGALCAVT